MKTISAVALAFAIAASSVVANAAPANQPKPSVENIGQEAKSLASDIDRDATALIRTVARGSSSASCDSKLSGDSALFAMWGNNYPNMRASQGNSGCPATIPVAAKDGWPAGDVARECHIATQVVNVDPFDLKTYVAQERQCVEALTFYAKRAGRLEEVTPVREKLDDFVAKYSGAVLKLTTG